MREYVDNVFCVLSRCKMWFEKCDSNFFVHKFFMTIRFRDLVWLFHCQCFWLFSLDLMSDACSFSTRRMTYVCSWCIKQRVLVFDLSSDICAFDEMTQTIVFHRIESDSSSENDSKMTQIIAFHQIASDSSNLTRATYQAWWEWFVSFVKTRFHQTCKK